MSLPPGGGNSGKVLEVRYQLIEKNGGDFNDPLVDSGWLERQFTWPVPSGQLFDGVTYRWRAQATDGCYVVNSSTTREFTVALAKWGSDERWAMWRQPLGNGMSLQVNQANGNLFLDYPLDALATPRGPLTLSLGFNSQQTRDFDFSQGWNLAVGPAADPGPLPVRLRELESNLTKLRVIQIRFSDGSVQHFPRLVGNHFTVVGGGTGIVTESPDEPRYRYQTPTGGNFLFNGNGNLFSATPSTGNFFPTENFDFVYEGTNLRQILDPLRRSVTVTWGASGPTRIDTWDGRFWSLAYGAGRLSSVTDPAGDVVSFGYNGSGDIQTVTDGKGQVTQVAYGSPQPNYPPKVTRVTPPGQNAAYAFGYTGPYRGSFAFRTDLTDPRGTTTQDPEDFTSRTFFNNAGLPIQLDGPRDQQGLWPQTTMIWDTNYNLLCRRAPSANVVSEGCRNPGNPQGFPEGPPPSDGLQTDFTYQNRPPHLLLSETGPFPNADGTGTRPTTSYAYDEGFQELYAEYFGGFELAGRESSAGFVRGIDLSWGNQGPGGGGTRSARLTGRVFIPNVGDRWFRVQRTGNVRLRMVVGEKLIFNCWATSSCSDQRFRFGNDGWKQFVLEFKDLDLGAGSFIRIQWHGGDGNYQTIPAASTEPEVNLLTSVTDPLGTTRYVYGAGDKERRRVTSEDRVDRRTSFTYDEFGRVLSVIDPFFKTTTYHYTAACLDRMVDRIGAVTSYVCNGAGDAIETTLDVRAVESQPAQTRQTRTSYDPLGRVDRVEVRIAGSWQLVSDNDYDDAGRLERVTDAIGAVTEYFYNPRGLLTRELLPDPDKGGPKPRPDIDHEYDLAGNETLLRDARDKQWITGYDALSRVISETDPLGNPTSTVYDLDLNQTRVTSPSGLTTTMAYDLLGRKISEKVGSLPPTTFAYDSTGNLKRQADPAGVYVAYDYNAFGEVAREARPTGPQGTEADVEFIYDVGGRLVQVTNERNNSTTYAYDHEGRTTSVTLPIASQRTTTFVYDDAGELVRTTDGAGRTRRFTYDERGRRTASTDARGTTTYVYDLASRLTEIRLPNTVTQRFEFDDLGRRTRRYGTNPNGQGAFDDERFDYDPSGNLTLAQKADGSLPVSLTYDDAGRLETVVARGRTTRYTYKSERLLSRQDAAGTTTFNYNPDTGLLQTLGDPVGGTASYGYDAFGRLASRTISPQNLASTWSYDQAGRIKTLQTRQGASGPTLASFTLGYDAASNVTSKSQQVTGAPAAENGTWTYTYDQADRLATARIAQQPLTTYGYDGAGNRTSVRVGQTTVTTTYDSAGHPDFASDGTDYNTDQLGQLLGITKPGTNASTYAYDTWGRMKGGTVGPSAVAYTYDALDRTVFRTVGGLQTAYHYAGTTEDLVREASETQNQVEVPASVKTYAWSPEGPLAVRYIDPKLGQQLRYLLADPHGDVVSLSTGTGNTGTISYSPWGERRQATGDASVTPFGFQGDWTDPATGQVDMMARHYAPSLGRFTTPDPLEGSLRNPLSLNPFIYGWDNPVTRTDPTGLCPDPAACNQLTGPSGQKHSKEFISRINNGGTDPNPISHSTEPLNLELPLRRFDRMPISRRIVWLRWFQRSFSTQGWFNAQHGVLRAFESLGTARPGSWASTVDAAILHSIQNGMALYLQKPRSGPNSGAGAWRIFFAWLLGRESFSDAALRAQWSIAEGRGTRFGIRTAESRGVIRTGGENAILQGSSIYRRRLRGANVPTLIYAIGVPVAGGWHWPDPRNSQVTYEFTRIVYQLNTPYGDIPCTAC